MLVLALLHNAVSAVLNNLLKETRIQYRAGQTSHFSMVKYQTKNSILHNINQTTWNVKCKMLWIRAHAYSILLWVLIKINIYPYNNLLQSFSLTSFDWYYCCRWYCIAELTVCKELWKSSQTASQPTFFPSSYGKEIATIWNPPLVLRSFWKPSLHGAFNIFCVSHKAIKWQYTVIFSSLATCLVIAFLALLPQIHINKLYKHFHISLSTWIIHWLLNTDIFIQG